MQKGIARPLTAQPLKIVDQHPRNLGLGKRAVSFFWTGCCIGGQEQSRFPVGKPKTMGDAAPGMKLPVALPRTMVESEAKGRRRILLMVGTAAYNLHQPGSCLILAHTARHISVPSSFSDDSLAHGRKASTMVTPCLSDVWIKPPHQIQSDTIHKLSCPKDPKRQRCTKVHLLEPLQQMDQKEKTKGEKVGMSKGKQGTRSLDT